jgi:hypothetical protein
MARLTRQNGRSESCDRSTFIPMVVMSQLGYGRPPGWLGVLAGGTVVGRVV